MQMSAMMYTYKKQAKNLKHLALKALCTCYQKCVATGEPMVLPIPDQLLTHF